MTQTLPETGLETGPENRPENGPQSPPGPAGQRCGCAGGRGLTRRSLLRQFAAAGALGTALAVADPFSSNRYAFAADPAYSGDVLVVLSLRGGFDGLSAVVPIGDPDYAARRPSIGIPQSSLIQLDSMFGLHPALAPLKKYWDAGSFGAIQAVGQASPSRSHFQAMQNLEQAAPGSSLRSGWLDRTVGTRAAGTVFQSAQVGTTQVSPGLAGRNPELSMTGIAGFQLSGAWDATQRELWTTALEAIHAGAATAIRAPATAALGAFATVSQLASTTYTPAGGAAYPQGQLGDALQDVARLIKAGLGLQVACVDEGDWDMHAGLGAVDKGWMHDQLTGLGAALAAFAADLGPQLDGVTLVTLSEFGRRVGENASGGVDHGHGNVVLMLGGGIAGGKVHGTWPGLSDGALVDGDLAGTTDYRQVLGEILSKRCGLGSLTDVFPGLTAPAIGVTKA